MHQVASLRSPSEPSSPSLRCRPVTLVLPPRLLQVIRRQLAGCTIIEVAHRQSTLAGCQRGAWEQRGAGAGEGHNGRELVRAQQQRQCG